MTTCRAAVFRACSRPRVASSALRIARPHFRNIRAPFLSRSSTNASDRRFGQPVHETHPHIVGPEELTPGITALEYHQRRAKLAAALPPGGVAVLAAADVKFRSGAVFYQFQQEANFYYLTGFDEPEAIAVIARNKADDDFVFHLFVRPKDATKESWEGYRSGLLAARDVWNADEEHDVYNMKRPLSAILDGAGDIFTDIPTKPSNTSGSFFSSWFAKSSDPAHATAEILSSSKVKPLKSILHEIRAIKSPAELAVMRKAGQMSGRAITAAMKRRWNSEKDLAAYLTYDFNRRGCDSDAYIPVVAGGENALSIHYTFNNARLKEDEMVLVDAGGQYGHYATDITRTWPLRKSFSPAQKDLYSAILDVQRACISLCRENAAVTLDTLHETTESGLKANLTDLGFDMSGYKAISQLFPHHVGHYVGLDLHDTPGLPRKERLKTGHVVTVEPGIYVPNDDRWPKHFQGLGIRIEDTVAVQAETPLILTTEAVKEVDDIEAILGTGEGWAKSEGHGPLYK